MRYPTVNTNSIISAIVLSTILWFGNKTTQNGETLAVLVSGHGSIINSNKDLKTELTAVRKEMADLLPKREFDVRLAELKQEQSRLAADLYALRVEMHRMISTSSSTARTNRHPPLHSPLSSPQ